jgi:hypothetical protein
MFYTTGELPMDAQQKQAFLDFIPSGHGFVGVHWPPQALGNN